MTDTRFPDWPTYVSKPDLLDRACDDAHARMEEEMEDTEDDGTKIDQA